MEKDLEKMMQKAAEALDFEKAAELRDMLQDLKKATQKTGKFSRLPYKLPVAIDPISDLTELRKVLSIRKTTGSN
jgi:excinuclease ABC subunit C